MQKNKRQQQHPFSIPKNHHPATTPHQMAGGTRDQLRCFDGKLQQYINVLSRE
jgi:hypothetical protein